MSQPVAAETNEASPSLWLPGPGAGGARPSQMPASPNPLIGREGDLAAVRTLLARDGVRLVTLTGPGGVGKTRLALAVAASAEEAFADGAAFVSLAPVQDAALAPAAIAAALEVQESGDQSLADDLIARLRDDRFLLVLDNFERLPDAAPLVADLLRGCPRLTVLVTSRRRLRLSGEHEIPVPPLPLADLDRPSTVEELAGVPSVRLFVERAQAAAAGFALTEANGRQIAEICRHLDGLPLAIELAAPRTRILSPAALLARLANRLQLLTGGPRDAPERLQTMRQAIAWSYDLLDPDHQTLLRHLAVFVGGFPLDAAEAVTSRRADEPASREEGRTHPPASRLAGSPTAFDLLSVLVEESLVQVADGADGERRFGMLETVREYALEQLVGAGEAEPARRRHASWCLGLTGHHDWAAELPSAQLDRLQAEHDNLRAALSWSIEHEPETALRLVGDSWRFWNERGYWSEGRGWVSRALAVCPEAPPDLRAAALAGAGALAINQGDYPEARRLLEAILPLAEQAGDESRAARTIRSLGIVASNQNDLDGAETLFAEALARLRPLGHPGVVGKCLTDLGLVAERRGDYARAIAFYEEALPLSRSSGDRTFVAIVLSNLGGPCSAPTTGDAARRCSRRHWTNPGRSAIGTGWRSISTTSPTASSAAATSPAPGSATGRASPSLTTLGHATSPPASSTAWRTC
ncbi:MAG: hypothetical protein AVDCRST_MAG59-1040 [uncultured Thermomicrobiales bacterium]|uniref:AAA+ ATPase domain-containing protein n=1 Tax=uncultured Thermomicrobiales bacterium TaxID=1645740 RepID=A0A6J4U7Q6_9BACT|nr:MAG: hypothetical protein AVDCRST_MAG59-1040 [uncultured Thermomicrobiales bacterium]